MTDPQPAASGPTVLLRDIAHGKSGDKGDVANIGVIALRPELYPAVVSAVTPEAVNTFLRRDSGARTEVHQLPTLGAVNVVLFEALQGGGTLSLRVDALAKNLVNVLLDMPVEATQSRQTAGEHTP